MNVKRVETTFAAGPVLVTPVYRRYRLYRCISMWICNAVCTENRISQSFNQRFSTYTVKKVSYFPVPSRDVTNLLYSVRPLHVAL